MESPRPINSIIIRFDMCLSIFIASNNPLPLIPWSDEKPAFHVIDLSDNEQVVRSHLSEPFVYYAGSHEGCGCAFNYGREYPEYENDPEEVRAGEESVNRLVEYLSSALRDAGPLRIFSCWAGEESKSPETFATVTPARIGEKTFVFQTPELLSIQSSG